MSTALALFLLLATRPASPDACNSGERTLPGVMVKFACGRSDSELVQWFTEKGSPKPPFRTRTGIVDRTKPMGEYEPKKVWVTVAGASACVRGTIRDTPPHGCYGLFEPPCAERTYKLEVTDTIVRSMSVSRSIVQQQEGDGRCDVGKALLPISSNASYTEGDLIKVSLLTERGENLCLFEIPLASLQLSSLEAKCDTRVGTWPAPRTAGRVTANQRIAGPRGVPDFVTLRVRAEQ